MKEVIPVKKNTYRSTEVQKVTAAQILALIVGSVIVFALDVAKKRVLLAITEADGTLARLVHFQMPAQLGVVFTLAKELAAADKEVQFVLEPTGTYGAPIAEGAHRHGHAVFMLSPKHTHDAASLFDNTPSKHDPKDACVIARLHAQQLARRWEPMPEERRERALQVRPLGGQRRRPRPLPRGPRREAAGARIAPRVDRREHERRRRSRLPRHAR